MGERPNLIGKLIVGVEWETQSQFGEAPSANEIDALVFSDGSSAVFHGSDQIGVSAVWVDSVRGLTTDYHVDALDLLRDIAARDDRPRYLPRVRALLVQVDLALANEAAPTTED